MTGVGAPLTFESESQQFFFGYHSPRPHYVRITRSPGYSKLTPCRRCGCKKKKNNNKTETNKIKTFFFSEVRVMYWDPFLKFLYPLRRKQTCRHRAAEMGIAPSERGCLLVPPIIMVENINSIRRMFARE